ncbi:GNAT family N-acetyltransferase [Phytoactinopolyspora halotolerans]|uniref:GNAT family N-acetyltransferase n=1 Tax=Phytoactinopolyspora halotolerans TaxID=1981512 RepID=A0A6L9S3Z2_9ACTN|nr:GNAT family N-acetyltransferase [Phytoactinopolyspora halotolerans]NEE00165.1 GNAT family N-acetyltransferase [Phytoactinopolyspora halotolerans]
MQIRSITVADADFSAWYDVHRCATEADFPNGPHFSERELRVVHEPHEHSARKLWIAEENGRVVGAAQLALPLRDNLKLAELEIFVRPEARRQGIGTALLDTVRECAREHSRTSLLTYLDAPSQRQATAGTEFLEHHGFTQRIVEIARVQRTPFDLDAIAKAEDHAKQYATDYQILTWRGRVPAEYVEEYARLEARMSTDAPLGELEYEPEVWDEARVRRSEERTERMGRSNWTAVAMAPDGTMAGVTRIVLADDSDAAAYQDTTLVDPAHRGHRLGLLLKAANLRNLLAARPGVEAIWTWNADSNNHMISINETLGYRVEGWTPGYQRDL